MKNRKYLALIVAVLALIYFLIDSDQEPQPASQNPPQTDETADVSKEATPVPLALQKAPGVQTSPNQPTVSMTVEGKKVTVPASPSTGAKLTGTPDVREFTTQDGVAVIEGDIVLGVPTSGANRGYAQLPRLGLWSTNEIAYFIQPSVSDQGRILDALRLFDATAVRFVPFTNQEDVLVFQNGTENCKSYVGRTGGKQPIWITPGCGPAEIAHELMHALGFTHEQNRTDRDRYIKINRDNIDPTKLTNFEKMPDEFMQLSGAADFSFDSIMIYSPDVFSRNGAATMEPLARDQRIDPKDVLSEQDIQRINRYYGSR
jgi:Astacin (Peptidase family M12A)